MRRKWYYVLAALLLVCGLQLVPANTVQAAEKDKAQRFEAVVPEEEIQTAGAQENGTSELMPSQANQTGYGYWRHNAYGWRFQFNDGSYATNTVGRVDGYIYAFNSSGYMITGWGKVQNLWYYAKSNGHVCFGWTKVGSKWYYMDKTYGYMYIGYHNIDGKVYCLNSNGSMYTGWKKDSGYWYYFNPGKGNLVLNAWKKIGSKWYHFQTYGIMDTNKWIGDCYVAGNGAMATGWKQLNGNWYYFRSNGYKYKKQWLKLSGKWYYLKSNGVMAKSEWIENCWCTSSGVWNPAYGGKTTVDLASYFDQNIYTAIKKLPSMKDEHCTDGSVGYTNGTVVLETGYWKSTKTVGYVSYKKACNYSIRGVKYGMTRAQAIASAQKAGYTKCISNKKTSSGWYCCYRNSYGQDLTFWCNNNGTVSGACASAYRNK